MRRLAVVITAPLLSLACVPDEPPAPDGIIEDFPDAPAPPDNGMELRMPQIEVTPGQDVTWCYVPDFVPDQDMVVKRAVAYQGSSGHHMAVYRSGVPRTPGEVFDCTSLETMVSMLPMVIPDDSEVDIRIMPEDFAVRVPAGSFIVLQAHIINANIQPIRVSDLVQFELATEGEELTEASYWVISDNQVVLPEGNSARTKECIITEQTKLVFQLGHMHEWGSKMSVTRTRGDVTEELYRVDEWTSEFRDNGPTKSYPATDPLVLAPGDVVHLNCEWNNDTGEEIRWPKEMCVTLGAYFPARGGGFIDCDESFGP
jgi:hypothetical protein